MVNALGLIDALDRFRKILPAVVGGLSTDNARWKPPDGAWSILEVVCHLGDEEEEDFRRRLALTLGQSTEPWPPIDPEGWALDRRYNEGKLDEALQRFQSARDASVTWLRSLDAPDWEQRYEHPKLGSIRAGDLLAAWTAHDQLHLRQIAKRLFQIAQRDGGEYSTQYAGRWTA